MLGRKIQSGFLQILRRICPYRSLAQKLRCWAKLKSDPGNHIYVHWREKVLDCRFFWLPTDFHADFCGSKGATLILHVPDDKSPKKYFRKAFPEISIQLFSNSRVEIGATPFGFPKLSRIRCFEGASVTVGKNFFGWRETRNDIGTRIYANASVSIGDDCMFSRGIIIRDSDAHAILDKTTLERINPPRPIEIGNKVWLGEDVTVLKGARIPDSCICGAHALVSKQFTESNCILAGVPAKVIRTNVVWDRRDL